MFSIRDFGKGIPTEELVLVFDKFQQGSNTEIGTTIGTELGLPICREIIDLHHGKFGLRIIPMAVPYSALSSRKSMSLLKKVVHEINPS